MKSRFLNIFGGLFLVISSLFWLGTTNQNEAPNSTVDSNKPAVVIGMTNSLNFDPDTVRIKVGQTVRWENSSLLVHSVTADSSKETKDSSVSLPDGAKPFDSGLMDPEQTFEYTFNVAGTYNYFCIPHEAMMRGVVIVEE